MGVPRTWRHVWHTVNPYKVLRLPVPICTQCSMGHLPWAFRHSLPDHLPSYLVGWHELGQMVTLPKCQRDPGVSSWAGCHWGKVFYLYNGALNMGGSTAKDWQRIHSQTPLPGPCPTSVTFWQCDLKQLSSSLCVLGFPMWKMETRVESILTGLF
jgi:hypothetical protein